MSTTTISRADIIALARATAAAHQLDAALVCAICEQESAWNPWAIRYEPAFYLHYIVPQLSAGKISHTEAQARAFSWGLMQVMGQVAREHNFGVLSSTDIAPNPNRAVVSSGNTASPQLHSPSSTVGAPLAQLCDPAYGLEIGCRVFAAKLAAAHGDAARALQLWNGGGNPNYAAEVLSGVAKYQML